MEIDVVRVLGLVSRSVRNFEKDGKAASAVTLTRLYDTERRRPLGRTDQQGTHPAMVFAGRGRPPVGRKVPAQGECGRDHHGVYAA